MDRPRILIADDHTMVAEAFKSLLEPDCHVVEMVSDGRSMLSVALEMKPDIVFVGS